MSDPVFFDPNAADLRCTATSDGNGSTTTNCYRKSQSDSCAVLWSVVFGLLVVAIVVSLILLCCGKKRKTTTINEQEIILAAATQTTQKEPTAAESKAAESKATTEPTKDDCVQIITTPEELEKLKEPSRPACVLVHASWCGHCKNTIPNFKDACNTMHAQGVECDFFMVDGHEIKEIHESHEIPGYPYFAVLFEDGTVVSRQPQQRTKEAIEAYVKEQLQNHLNAAPDSAGKHGDA